jgi:hypothetical protein
MSRPLRRMLATVRTKTQAVQTGLPFRDGNPRHLGWTIPDGSFTAA